MHLLETFVIVFRVLWITVIFRVNRKILRLPLWSPHLCFWRCRLYHSPQLQGRLRQGCWIVSARRPAGAAWRHENQEREDRSLAQAAAQMAILWEGAGLEQGLAASAPLTFRCRCLLWGEAVLCPAGCLATPGFYLRDVSSVPSIVATEDVPYGTKRLPKGKHWIRPSQFL